MAWFYVVIVIADCGRDLGLTVSLGCLVGLGMDSMGRLGSQQGGLRPEDSFWSSVVPGGRRGSVDCRSAVGGRAQTSSHVEPMNLYDIQILLLPG